MSDSISTVSTNLSNASNLINCGSMITNIILIVLLSCVISMLMSINFKGNCGMSEYFTDFFSSKKVGYVTQTVELNAPDTNPSLTVAKCNRFVNENNVLYEIYANLYLLNGNIFAKEVVDESYVVYLGNGRDQRLLLGKLSVNSDKVYKLKTTTDLESLKYDTIYIMYSGKVLLVGKFR